MNTWASALLSTLLVSIVSLVGIGFLSMNQQRLQKIIFILVSFAVGALFGDAFFHLLPESIEMHQNPTLVGGLIIAGLLSFFTLEKFILWRHDHRIPHDHKTIKPLGYMSLVADGFHNFIDGLLIGASYLVSPHLGITTTIAVILHEIPQEIGDFGVLVHSGFSVRKALWLNFITACTAVLGTIVVLFLGNSMYSMVNYTIPFAAGGFIYLAGCDLIPELKKNNSVKQSLLQLCCILSGMIMLYLFRFIEQ
ncbi:MAG: ZIP family metal transporter [Bacteroidales bacterium]|nr:ZIP family metal transporter [Bacteroidales bacterium]